MTGRKVRLGLSMHGLGYHPSAWLDPDVPPNGALSIAHYIEMTKAAERGLFDMVFVADHVGIIVEDTPKGVFGKIHDGFAELEPLTLLGALSQVTSHVGLVATASTTLHQPYQLARQFASIDHLSGGRVGWNVVTSSRDAEARNFSEDKMLDKSLRYEKAREAISVCLGLWESWEPDAFSYDRKTETFFDRTKLHAINHKGRFFRVDGPLTIPPTPQGRPVIVQAGQSEDGIDFAASFAEVIYAVHTTLDTARPFYKKVKDRVEKFGRRREDVLIMPGFMPVVGRTRDEAKEKYTALQYLLAETVGLQKIVRFFGDLSKYDLDGPLPDLRTDIPTVSRGGQDVQLARKNNWSIRQFIRETVISHSHSIAIGTPADIVDHMEQWLDEEAADGFNILPAISPRDINEFVDLVVPEMQRRGLYRTEYESTTLRGNLGLSPTVYGQGLRLHPAQRAVADDL